VRSVRAPDTLLLERFSTPGEQMPFVKKLGLGLTAGGTAALMGVPSEVCLVRMGADSKKPEAERRNYKNVLDAVFRIGREEGVAALWSGAGPTIARACLLNAGQLGVYSEAKEVLSAKAGLSGIPLQFVGAFIASIAANSETASRQRRSPCTAHLT
jgi:solute carrier family 25 oxoglutarate transporter 11